MCRLRSALSSAFPSSLTGGPCSQWRPSRRCALWTPFDCVRPHARTYLPRVPSIACVYASTPSRPLPPLPFCLWYHSPSSPRPSLLEPTRTSSQRGALLRFVSSPRPYSCPSLFVAASSPDLLTFFPTSLLLILPAFPRRFGLRSPVSCASGILMISCSALRPSRPHHALATLISCLRLCPILQCSETARQRGIHLYASRVLVPNNPTHRRVVVVVVERRCVQRDRCGELRGTRLLASGTRPVAVAARMPANPVMPDS